ncbi:type II toxin-antitoxin system HicA family toxin [Serratia fonticola]|uniref:type II toxin-antitoxin system HicA family toxin n=1 Tax=Serratia fonticola TaxID=47917 RepID=UPI003BB5EB70
MNSSELIKRLEVRVGFYNGSKAATINSPPNSSLVITVPHPNKEGKLGTLRQIMKDAGLLNS